MSSQRGLKVRGAERQSIELPVEFIIAEEQRAQVRFSSNSSAMEQFAVSGTTFDLSAGGLGFRANQFLPRQLEGTIRIMGPAASGAGAAASPAEVRIEHTVKVRRVWMNNNDREMYSIGLAFVDPTPALESLVATVTAEYEKSVAARGASASGVRSHA